MLTNRNCSLQTENFCDSEVAAAFPRPRSGPNCCGKLWLQGSHVALWLDESSRRTETEKKIHSELTILKSFSLSNAFWSGLISTRLLRRWNSLCICHDTHQMYGQRFDHIAQLKIYIYICCKRDLRYNAYDSVSSAAQAHLTPVFAVKYI